MADPEDAARAADVWTHPSRSSLIHSAMKILDALLVSWPTPLATLFPLLLQNEVWTRLLDITVCLLASSRLDGLLIEATILKLSGCCVRNSAIDSHLKKGACVTG